ncbi:MAG: fused MFS/spermidine synthase [Sedimentisphaerales bacterium]
MNKSKSFMSIFIPSATVFISSFCIMVIELVASRLIARNLGSSLYTWTAVIGVILGGITIGNYLGGRIADKFPAKKTVAVIFAICSVTCVITVILNNIVGEWTWLWYFSWPLHVFTYTSIVFLLPSTLLGTISPVIAKMALDRGLPTGRTIGDIYAWSAAGSIAGTFAAGFWLIAAFGTITIIWTIGAVLLMMSVLYWTRCYPLYIWAVIFTALMTMAMIPAEWAKNTGSSIKLRERPDPNIIYEDESQYFYIAVKQAADDPNRRFLTNDQANESEILLGNALDLQWFYEKIYAAVTRGISGNKEKLCVMNIGGGGYVFPRYIEKVWPGSRIDVVEIDPAVTKAAMKAFGLEKNTTINTINMDARNYVDKLFEQKNRGREVPRYDFIYGDAFIGYSIPFHLVTREFNEKLFAILGDNGVYIMNLMDTLDPALFLGSVVDTLKETFPCVYVVTDDDFPYLVRNFVIIAAKHNLDLKNIISQYKGEGKLKVRYLDASTIRQPGQKSRRLVLTDDYSPAENLLTPMVRDSARMNLAAIFYSRAKELNQKVLFEDSIKNCLLAIKTYPRLSVLSYGEIGTMYTKMGYLDQAADAFNKAIEYNEKSDYKISTANAHSGLGTVLQKQGKTELANEEFRKAAEEFRRETIEKPVNYTSWRLLGETLAMTEDYKAATEAFKKALALNPNDPLNYNNLMKALELQERYVEEIEVLKNYIQLMKQYKQNDAVSQLQKHLEFIKQKASSEQKN